MPSITSAVVVYAVFLGLAFTANTQGNAPQCVTNCLSVNSNNVGCSGPQDFSCACQFSSFMTGSDRCFSQTCSAADAQIGENIINMGCSNTSTSIPPPFSPPATTSLTVTNTETSPPQSSQPGSPSSTTNLLTPPTPPSSSTASVNTPTQPLPISSVTSTLVSGTLGTPLSPSISSSMSETATISSVTSAAAATVNTTQAVISTKAANTTSGTFTFSSATTTVPSGTIQSVAPSTSSSGALRIALQSENIILLVSAFAGIWMFL